MPKIHFYFSKLEKNIKIEEVEKKIEGISHICSYFSLVYIINSIGNVLVGRVAQLVAHLVEAQVLAAEFTFEEAAEEFAATRVLKQLVNGEAPATNAPLWNVLYRFLHVPEFGRVGDPGIGGIRRRDKRIEFNILLEVVCVALAHLRCLDVATLQAAFQELAFLLQILNGDHLVVLRQLLTEKSGAGCAADRYGCGCCRRRSSGR